MCRPPVPFVNFVSFCKYSGAWLSGPHSVGIARPFRVSRRGGGDLTSARPGDHPRDSEPFLMNENPEHAGRPWQFPPLIARELLAYSRQPWTYWLRLLSALGAVSVLGIIAMTGRNRLGQADGRSLFAG